MPPAAAATARTKKGQLNNLRQTPKAAPRKASANASSAATPSNRDTARKDAAPAKAKAKGKAKANATASGAGPLAAAALTPPAARPLGPPPKWRPAPGDNNDAGDDDDEGSGWSVDFDGEGTDDHLVSCFDSDYDELYEECTGQRAVYRAQKERAMEREHGTLEERRGLRWDPQLKRAAVAHLEENYRVNKPSGGRVSVGFRLGKKPDERFPLSRRFEQAADDLTHVAEPAFERMLEANNLAERKAGRREPGRVYAHDLKAWWCAELRRGPDDAEATERELHVFPRCSLERLFLKSEYNKYFYSSVEDAFIARFNGGARRNVSWPQEARAHALRVLRAKFPPGVVELGGGKGYMKARSDRMCDCRKYLAEQDAEFARISRAAWEAAMAKVGGCDARLKQRFPRPEALNHDDLLKWIKEAERGAGGGGRA